MGTLGKFYPVLVIDDVDGYRNLLRTISEKVIEEEILSLDAVDESQNVEGKALAETKDKEAHYPQKFSTFKSFTPLLNHIFDKEDQKFVVVVDWNLLSQSLMSGPELVRYFRKHLSHRVVCIVLTGSDEPDIERQALAAGAKLYLRKMAEVDPGDLPTRQADKQEKHTKDIVRRIITYSRQEVADQLLTVEGHDELSGLPNYRGFMVRAVDELKLARRAYQEFMGSKRRNNRRKGPLSSVLVCIDLDRFKSINDQFGHFRGDDVIRAYGSIVQRHSRPSDISGRYHGDEFLMLFHGQELADVKRAIDLQNEELGQVTTVRDNNGHVIPLSLTAGFAVIHHSMLVEGGIEGVLLEAIRLADEELVETKAARKGGLTMRP